MSHMDIMAGSVYHVACFLVGLHGMNAFSDWRRGDNVRWRMLAASAVLAVSSWWVY